jgi:tetratricopeptide (TPR) repeat protein
MKTGSDGESFTFTFITENLSGMSELCAFSEIFGNLKLSTSEKLIVSQFLKTSKSKSFVSVAEILKNHGKKHEAIELLSLGLEWYPRYSAARVVLAKEFYERGMMEEAWDLLHSHGDNYEGNFTALKLILKLAIMLGMQEETMAVLKKLRDRNLSDDEIEHLDQRLHTLRFEAVRHEVIEDAQKSGIKLLSFGLPVPVVKEQNLAARSAASCRSLPDKATFDMEARLTGSKGFYVAPVTEVLRQLSVAKDDFEYQDLDSGTQAQIYEHQGYFGKAIEIYRQLLHESPQNEFFRAKVKELGEALRKQQQQDVWIDSKIVLQLKRTERINRKIRYLYKLMDRLE